MIPATSDPRTVGYVVIIKPVSRWKWSTGLRAMAFTSMSTSFGPGVGVAR